MNNPPPEAYLNWIGLARRAGRLAPGDREVARALTHHRVRLLWLAEDSGMATRRKYGFWAANLGVPVVLRGTKAELGRAAGMRPLAVLAILDARIAERILQVVDVTVGGWEFGRKRQDSGLRAGEGVETRQPAADRPPAPAARREHQKSHEHRGAGGGSDRSGHHARQVAPRSQTRQSGPDQRAAASRSASGKAPRDGRATAEAAAGPGRQHRAADRKAGPGAAPGSRRNGAPARGSRLPGTGRRPH